MIPKAPVTQKELSRLLKQGEGPALEFKRSGAPSQLESEPESQLESELESLEHRVVAVLRKGPMGKTPLSKVLRQKQVSGPLHKAIRGLLAKGLIERTIPDKPQSRLQKYRRTEEGMKTLETKRD